MVGSRCRRRVVTASWARRPRGGCKVPKLSAAVGTWTRGGEGTKKRRTLGAVARDADGRFLGGVDGGGGARGTKQGWLVGWAPALGEGAGRRVEESREEGSRAGEARKKQRRRRRQQQVLLMRRLLPALRPLLPTVTGSDGNWASRFIGHI